MNNIILDFFGFSYPPFSKNLKPKDAYMSKSYEEAKARLEYGVKDEDVMLLTGPVGSGKSAVLSSFIHTLDKNAYIPIYIRGTFLNYKELYKLVLAGLNVHPPHMASKAKRQFYKIIPELSKKPVIIIDDIQDATDEAFLSIKTMTNFDSDSKSYVTFILSGQPEIKARLRFNQFLALKQRIRVFFHMKSLSLTETCEYIDHHTKKAGNPSAVFSDSAKVDVHKSSEGIPRRINVICFRSILNAAINDINIIDSDNLLLDDPTED